MVASGYSDALETHNPTASPAVLCVYKSSVGEVHVIAGVPCIASSDDWLIERCDAVSARGHRHSADERLPQRDAPRIGRIHAHVARKAVDSWGWMVALSLCPSDFKALG